MEALGLFLWMVGGPEPVSQAQNRFKRSKETIHHKFEVVLECLVSLAMDSINQEIQNFPLCIRGFKTQGSIPISMIALVQLMEHTYV
jgi:hypothetical protein